MLYISAIKQPLRYKTIGTYNIVVNIFYDTVSHLCYTCNIYRLHHFPFSSGLRFIFRSLYSYITATTYPIGLQLSDDVLISLLI